MKFFRDLILTEKTKHKALISYKASLRDEILIERVPE